MHKTWKLVVDKGEVGRAAANTQIKFQKLPPCIITGSRRRRRHFGELKLFQTGHNFVQKQLV